MSNLKEDDKAMREVLINAKVIAVVGHSDIFKRFSKACGWYRLQQATTDKGAIAVVPSMI